MSLAKFNGNNVGGIVSMWVMPLTSYNGTAYNVLTGMHKLINSFNEFGRIYFTDGTCEVKITEKRCNELEFELIAKIPKVRPETMALFNYMRIPFVLIMQDANDQFQIVGSEVDPLLMDIKQEKGGEVSDFNHTLLSIKRDLMMKPLWIEDPRIKSIVPIPDPEEPEEPEEPVLPGDVIEVFSMLDFRPYFFSNGKVTEYPSDLNVTWFNVVFNGETITNTNRYMSYQIEGDDVIYYNCPLVEFREKNMNYKSGYFRWMLDVLCPAFPGNVIGFDFVIVNNNNGTTTKRYNYKVDFIPSSEWQSLTIDMHLPDWFNFNQLTYASIGFRCNKSYMQPIAGTTIRVRNLKLMNISLV